MTEKEKKAVSTDEVLHDVEEKDKKNQSDAEKDDNESIGSSSEKKERRCCGGKGCDFAKKNAKSIIFVAVLIIVIALGSWYKQYRQGSKDIVSPKEAQDKMVNFIKANMVKEGTDVAVKSFEKENGMYKAVIEVQKQEVTTYLSLDAKRFFPQFVDMEQAKDDAKQAAAEQKEIPKSDKPTVELFVMSYCPYGLQMERGYIPAIEQLGNKIDAKLKFVGYTLHGQKEVDENTRQYCIQKDQPTKLNAYLKCFWKKSSGESVACMKTVGINAFQVKSCMDATNKQYAPTEKDYSINKEEAAAYDVQGSPTLVINGVVAETQRDSDSILKAICSAFSNPPAECSKQISSAAPAAGFDDQSGGSGSGSASCGTN